MPLCSGLTTAWGEEEAASEFEAVVTAVEAVPPQWTVASKVNDYEGGVLEVNGNVNVNEFGMVCGCLDPVLACKRHLKQSWLGSYV